MKSFSEWRRDNSGTRADYDAYADGLVQAAARADTALSADEIHVLLDAVSGPSVLPPWEQYDNDPDCPDPKTTEEGWRGLLASATAKLNARLSTL